MKNIVLGMSLMASFWTLVAFTYFPDAVYITISADKMNVLYCGLENPISVAATGLKADDIELTTSDNVTLKRYNGGSYTAIVSGGNKATISVLEKKTKKVLQNFDFRVKHISSQILVTLGGKKGGNIGSGEMRTQLGLIAQLEGFDFDATCSMNSFTLYHTSNNEINEYKGLGGTFSGDILKAIQNAKVGDQYQFVEVKARCPGDFAGRSVNSLAFTIR